MRSYTIRKELHYVSSIGQPSSIWVSPFYSMMHQWWVRKSDISSCKTKVQCLEITQKEELP